MTDLRAKGLARTVECGGRQRRLGTHVQPRSTSDFSTRPARRAGRRRVPAIAAGALLIAALPAPALAYGGPGLGLGIISAVFGVLGALLLGFIAVLWYPFKRLIRRLRRTSPTPFAQPDSSDPELDIEP
jgi:hypothetical protein